MTPLALAISFVVGVVASLGAAFLFAPAQDLVTAAVVRSFGWLPSRRQVVLSGTWRFTWHVESSRYPPEVVDESARIRQLGRRVYARFRTTAFHGYFVGEIDGGRYLTGRWYDATKGGYHGAFQLIIDPSTHNLAGKWVGYSMSGVVKEGDLEMDHQR